METVQIQESEIEAVLGGQQLILPLPDRGMLQLWYDRGKLHLRVVGEEVILGAGTVEGKGGEPHWPPDALP